MTGAARPPAGVGAKAKRFVFDRSAFRWPEVDPQAYKFNLGDTRGMGWRGIMRFTLAGPPAWPMGFELRYFELDPGGYSSFEKHAHMHVIVAIRGKGRAVVGGDVYALEPFDVLHVPPLTPHRWLNEGDTPFGFLCPVDSPRDPPQPLSDQEWEILRGNPVTAAYTF
jgi:S-methyl-1-thioxylulose 5-phosphate methylthiotransferase